MYTYFLKFLYNKLLSEKTLTECSPEIGMHRSCIDCCLTSNYISAIFVTKTNFQTITCARDSTSKRWINRQKLFLPPQGWSNGYCRQTLPSNCQSYKQQLKVELNVQRAWYSKHTRRSISITFWGRVEYWIRPTRLVDIPFINVATRNFETRA